MIYCIETSALILFFFCFEANYFAIFFIIVFKKFEIFQIYCFVLRKILTDHLGIISLMHFSTLYIYAMISNIILK